MYTFVMRKTAVLAVLAQLCLCSLVTARHRGLLQVADQFRAALTGGSANAATGASAIVQGAGTGLQSLAASFNSVFNQGE